MPSVATKLPSIESLQAHFPLTFPVPNPKTHPDLITTNDLHREEDLLRNPTSFRSWWTAINTTREAFIALQKIERPPDLPEEVASLLGPLAPPLGRISLQRLTYLYEAALVQFPGSFKLWKSYLNMRMSFILGRLIIKKRAGGKKKLPEMKDALGDELEDLEQWEGGLDGVIGWEEWKSLVATFERALMWLPKVRLFSYLLNLRNITSDLAATSMAHVSVHFFAPILSSDIIAHTYSPYIRQSIAHSAPLSPLASLGTLPALG